MSATLRNTGIVVVLAGLGWLGWAPVRSLYLNPRVDIEQRRVKHIATVERYRAGVDDSLRIRTALQAYADRTLGDNLEAVDHELRTRLNRIGEEVGLSKLSVGTGRVRRMESPARNLPPFRPHRELREELDFVEVEASVSGVGSLEAAMRLVHRIEAEPWMKRVVQVRLQPRDNGERFVVTIRLVTLYLPGRTPARPLETVADLGGFERYQLLVRRNPFRLAVEPLTTPRQPAAPPPAGRTTEVGSDRRRLRSGWHGGMAASRRVGSVAAAARRAVDRGRPARFGGGRHRQVHVRRGSLHGARGRTAEAEAALRPIQEAFQRSAVNCQLPAGVRI